MPNRAKGRHWGSLAAVRKAANWQAFVLTKAAVQVHDWTQPEGCIPLAITFVMPDKRKRDVDNLLAACKQSLDGMAQALGVDDSRFRPILLDWVQGDGEGATLVSVGPRIQTTMEVV